MTTKLERKPFLHTAVILAALFIILLVFAIGMFYYIFAIPEPEGLSLASWPDTFTDNFSTWIEEKDGVVGVEEIGVERLDEYGLWVQIVDESGRELFAHGKPGHYPERYSMADLLALADSKYENGNTVFYKQRYRFRQDAQLCCGFPICRGKIYAVL